MKVIQGVRCIHRPLRKMDNRRVLAEDMERGSGELALVGALFWLGKKEGLRNCF